MPIYEFYCKGCNTLFNFFSRKVNTHGAPACPRCARPALERQVSLFSATGAAKEPGGDDDLPIDEAKMEKAMGLLAGEAEKINEDDPRQAAQLMRKFSSVTGLQLGKNMEEALGRLEAGEDPDAIEQDMGNLLENDQEPFLLPEKKGAAAARRRLRPNKDPKLYEM